MHTSYETILLQRFQEMGHYCILRTVKTSFLISTRDEWSVIIWDVPYNMHTSYETMLLQLFQDMVHYYILEGYNQNQNQNQNQLYSPSVCKHTRNLLWFFKKLLVHTYIHINIHTYIHINIHI